MALGQIIGGAVDESARQRKLRMDEEDQSFQREEQGARRDERARAERIRQGIAGIQRPGTYDAVEPAADGMGPTREGFKVTDDQYYGNLSGLYAREGMIEQAEGMRDRADAVQQKQRTKRQQAVEDGILAAGRAASMGDLATGFQTLAQTYDQVPDGYKLVSQQGPNGQLLAGLAGPDGKWRTQPQPLTPENFNQLLDNARKFTSTQMWSQLDDLGIKKRQVGAAEAQAGAAVTNANTNEAYRTWMQNQPKFAQDGTGQIYSISADGRTQLGVFGNKRPVGGGGGAGGRELPQEMVVALNEAAAAVDNAKTPQERQAAQQRYMNLYSNAATAMGKVLKPGEIKGSFEGYNNVNRDPMLNDFEVIRQSILTNKDMMPLDKQAQLAQLDKQRNFHVISRQVPNLAPDERVPELRKLVQSNMFSREELTQMGFNLREMREASKPEALSQPKATNGGGSGGSATTPAAPFPSISGSQSGSSLEQLRGLVRNQGQQQPRVDVQGMQPQPVPFGVQRW